MWWTFPVVHYHTLATCPATGRHCCRRRARIVKPHANHTKSVCSRRSAVDSVFLCHCLTSFFPTFQRLVGLLCIQACRITRDPFSWRILANNVSLRPRASRCSDAVLSWLQIGQSRVMFVYADTESQCLAFLLIMRWNPPLSVCCRTLCQQIRQFRRVL